MIVFNGLTRIIKDIWSKIRMIRNIIIQWISTHILLCVVIMILIVLLPYIIVFAQNGISHKNEDWSHLGGYINGTLGIVTIFLLYLTYREQRATNHIEHFEKILFKHIDEIVRLQEKYKGKMYYLCNYFMNFFFYIGEYHYNNEYTKSQAKSAIQYRYSNLANVELNDRSFEDVLRYIEYSLSQIENDNLIDAKDFYSLEIKNNLTTETKVVLFFYLISEKSIDVLNLFNKRKFFKDLNIDNEMFKFIVSMFCVSSDSKTETDESLGTPDLFEIKDNTTFYDIIDHFKEIESQRNNSL